MSQAEAPPREVGSAGEHPGCRGGRSEQRGEGRPGAASNGRQAPPRVRRGGRRGGRVVGSALAGDTVRLVHSTWAGDPGRPLEQKTALSSLCRDQAGEEDMGLGRS